MRDLSNSNGNIPLVQLAHIQGGGLTQLIITQRDPLTFYLFLNARVIEQTDVESMSILIDASDGNGDGTIHATLTHYVPSISGGKNTQTVALFPGIIEIVVEDRRIWVVCPMVNSFDGLWVGLGLRPDGEPHVLTGLKSFNFVLEGTLVHASLTWMDGTSELILPEE